MKNRQIILAARPEGLPKQSDFRLVESEMPKPGQGQFLVKIHYLSVDPYMRGRIAEAKSYAEPVGIGEVMVGGTVGTVVESQHPGYRRPRVLWHLIVKRARAEGFLVFDFAHRYSEAQQQVLDAINQYYGRYRMAVEYQNQKRIEAEQT